MHVTGQYELNLEDRSICKLGQALDVDQLLQLTVVLDN